MTLIRCGGALLALLMLGCQNPNPDLAETPLVATKDPFSAPLDALSDHDVQACGIYQEQVCQNGTLQRCATYDVGASSFVTPDPLTERALMYERWNDLYHSPDGQSAKIRFVGETPGTMSEAEWASPDHFARYNGLGDSAIWTGTTLNARILRYVETGTEVDYQRVEEFVRTVLTMFDVTGIPGYLARYHFYLMPEGGPINREHAIFYASQLTMNHTYNEIESPELVEDLPPMYLEGLDDSTGQAWTGTPMWVGTPTIDQYSGLTTSLPAAWGLLRDDSLKQRIVENMTCYLKRLRRMEVINIQSNADAAATVSTFLDSQTTQLDSDDIQFSDLDRIVFYYTAQPNSLNWDTFDRSCPDTLALEPTRIIDADSFSFESDLIDLIGDLEGKYSERENGIDHYYIPNARGYDAVHLMGLAAMAYHFTGDEMYLDFLRDELIGNLRSTKVAQTFSAVLQPRWCRKWYGSHIAIAPLWGINNLLDSSVLSNEMQRVMYEEAWLKDASELGNAKFAMMFAGTVSEENGSGMLAAGEEGVSWLRELQGNDGVALAPRRSYTVDYTDIASRLQDSGSAVEPVCPTEEIFHACEDGPTVFGIPLGGTDITETCTGADNECTMSNGQCAEKRASAPLPVDMRRWWGFQWQGDPSGMGVDAAVEGEIQSAGVDMFESYWLARHYDLVPEAEGRVLAWEDTGEVCP